MQHFSEKIRQKKESDRRTELQAVWDIYDELGARGDLFPKTGKVDNFIEELERVCVYFNLVLPDISDTITEVPEIMEFVMKQTGILQRKVTLKGKWWKEGSTPLICSDKEGNVHALIPGKNGGYTFYQDGRMQKVMEQKEKEFLNEAYCLYQPLPQRAMTMKEFYQYLGKTFTVFDVFWLLGLSLAAALLGMVLPKIYRFILHSVVPSGTSDQLFGISILLGGSIVISAFISVARSIWVLRIGNKMELFAQNAMWGRLLSLPVNFFRKYESGELSQRAMAINEVCQILGGQLVPTTLACVFSSVYLFQIYQVSSRLFLPFFIVVLCVLTMYTISSVLQLKMEAENQKVKGKLSSLVFNLLNGLTKIKIAGAESRAFAKWAAVFQNIRLIPPKLLTLSAAIQDGILFGGTIIFYITAYRADMSVSDYVVFHSAFALFLGAITAFASVIRQISRLRISMEMIKPLIEEQPEHQGYKKRVSRLTGKIELNRVKFRYSEDLPYVLDEMELHIEPGEYVGIVGSSGCGKSTLFRILLGFETPESGSVYYDMQDMDGLDVKSVRSRIGVVLQNGKLFAGDIFSNIAVCAPWMTLDDAWDVAERCGLADDIEAMPMGMFTMISEGGGGLSGGQQQRLLIARALAANPDILMFDEATSALDNITQGIVVKTLENMRCTRLVIAHRLSTIRKCSRIIYLHQGKVVEEGTFEELIEKGGRFAQMAKRQMV